MKKPSCSSVIIALRSEVVKDFGSERLENQVVCRFALAALDITASFMLCCTRAFVWPTGPHGSVPRANARERELHCRCSTAKDALPTRRVIISLAAIVPLMDPSRHRRALAEQGIQASDYTVPALSTQEYVRRIEKQRREAWNGLRDLADNAKYLELSNSLVLSPVDDIRQSVLYIPSALLKEGKRQEAISSRKAYTDYMRELKKLDELSQKAARYEADDEDVLESIQRLDLRLDDVLSTIK